MAEPKPARVTLEPPARQRGAVLDAQSHAGVANLVLHAADRGSPVAAAELFPFMGSHRPNVQGFTEHVAGKYGQAGGADRLANDLLRTSMASVLSDPQRVPEQHRESVAQAVHAFLAPALLGFATARVANGGQPFASTLREHTVVHEPVFRTWGDSEAISKRTAGELGLGALRAEQRAQAEALTAGLELAATDPRRAAALEQYRHDSAKTDAAVAPILASARRAGYGELASEARAPMNPYEQDKVGRVDSGHTSTDVRIDEFRSAFNRLLQLEQADPAGFAAKLQKVTVDPTAFLAVLVGEHVYPDGGLGTLARAARPKLVDPGDDSVLARLGDLYGAMTGSAEHRPLLSTDKRSTYYLPNSLGRFLAERAQLDPRFGGALDYASSEALEFGRR